MEALEDLWASFAGALYELRIPLIVASLVVAVVVILVARRRGWFAAARRHPGRSSVLAVVVLAIGLPVTWYLASPLVIRTELDEPSPVAVTSSQVPAPSVGSPTLEPAPETATPTASASTAPAPTSTATPFAPIELASGEFHGSDDFHFGEGTAVIIEVEPGRYHLRLEDFSVRNGPDLFVYLSPSAKGYAKGALELGKLKATDGSFGYDLPEGTDPAAFASAVIWCKQFSHLFATAPFEGA